MTDSQTPDQAATPSSVPNNNRKFMTGCLVAIGVVVLLAGGCTALVVAGGRSANTNPDNSQAAVRACESSVKARLKSPSTAEFTDGVTGSDPYTVTGTVDSQNGFGAMLRSSFKCTVSANETSVDYLE